MGHILRLKQENMKQDMLDQISTYPQNDPLLEYAQMAELNALTRVCQLAREKRVNIHKQSGSAFGVVHNFGMLQKQRGLLISTVALPKEVTIIKLEDHLEKRDNMKVKENALADQYSRRVPSLTKILALRIRKDQIFKEVQKGY